MSDTRLVAVEVPLVGDPRLKNWAKVVESVDDSRSSGYAFGGYFVAAGGVQDVPSGGILIVFGEKGSRGNPRAEARVYTINSDGTLSHEHSAQGPAWARTIRDRVADLVAAPAAETGHGIAEDLDRFSTEVLVAELERRGWRADS